ncbi:MAG TPA: ABC transporter ATP-binding protein [Chloroflexota bacterium]|jgi:ABC-2 type transport system ATP-binding protein|nr:ABC transporter ATP-binding protein [Chloroflexota bacterium]
MAAASVVTLAGVSKRFDHAEAVSDLSLDVAPGQIFGLIGPSGSGKTTTIRLLVGVLKPDDGEIRVMGSDPSRFSTRQRERIGYSPQGFFLYPTLTAKENVRFVAGLFGVGWGKRRRRTREVLQVLELWDARDRMTRNLSGGMQRRLELACALVHDPSLLFVDEPTAGLDPVLRQKIWEFLRGLRSAGTTIFVTTQLIEEIQHCDNVAIMNHGKLVALGSPAALRRQAMRGEAVEVVVQNVSQAALQQVRALEGVNALRWTDAGDLRVMVEDAARATPAVTQTLSAAGSDVTAVREYVPSFDEVFTRLVEEKAETDVA